MFNAILQIVLLPILLLQGAWVALRVPRLPEAEGPRTGLLGTGRPLKVLIVGDSSSVGVGVATQDDALAGHVARALSESFRVSWTVVGRNGATTRGLSRDLERESAMAFDVAIIALGVNDVKNGVPLRLWIDHYAGLVSQLRERFGASLVLASGLPPFGELHILPQPLRYVLGRRSIAFDEKLAALARATDGLVHLPFDGALDPTFLAKDGLHPSPALYSIWAERVADAFNDNWGG